jgi:hypothetical protein
MRKTLIIQRKSYALLFSHAVFLANHEEEGQSIDGVGKKVP